MKQWPHAPIHIVDESGTFMVTAATFKKQLFFNTSQKLQYLEHTLLKTAVEMGWQLQAWAIFPNHYHFISLSPEQPETLPTLIKKIHGSTSNWINREDGIAGRKIWMQYWDSRITFQKSYYSRLNYVHNNPVYHGVVSNALNNKWCSASWFERTAEESFRNTVASFKSDFLKIPDNF
jgi:putative transposase